MIGKDEVKKIASLARLELTDAEIESYAGELSSILEYMQNLSDIDVSQVEATCHVHGATNVFREDIVVETLSSETVKEIAPDSSGSYIRVPLIIGGE